MTEEIVDAREGRVRCEHRRAAIVGAGPGRDRAPYGDPSWCTWAINEIPQRAFTRHFELHPVRSADGWGAVQSAKELRWLERCPAPCYVLDLDDAGPGRVGVTDGGEVEFRGVANAVRYPLGRLRASGAFRDYFTCTFAYQVALAVLDGFEEVALYGVQLYRGTPRERTLERACTDYWIGFAEGRGLRVSEDSGMAREPYLYGYDYAKELQYAEHEVARLRAAIHDEDYYKRNVSWLSERA